MRKPEGFRRDASVLVVSSEHSREYWMNRVQEIFEYYGQLYQNLTDCLLKGGKFSGRF